MLPPQALTAAGSPEERRLARLYRSLEPADRRTLVAFAEFLAHGRPSETAPEPVQEPNRAPRPEEETVIAAIRRLSLSYSMLDREPMLHETSALMTAHVMKGRGSAEVIDELESLFERHYQDYRARLGSADTGEGPAKPDP